MKLLEVMTTCYNSQTEAEEDEKFPKPRENHSRPLCAYHTGGVMNKVWPSQVFVFSRKKTNLPP